MGERVSGSERDWERERVGEREKMSVRKDFDLRQEAQQERSILTHPHQHTDSIATPASIR